VNDDLAEGADVFGGAITVLGFGKVLSHVEEAAI